MRLKDTVSDPPTFEFSSASVFQSLLTLTFGEIAAEGVFSSGLNFFAAMYVRLTGSCKHSLPVCIVFFALLFFVCLRCFKG